MVNKIMIGCPVRNRAWILPEYLKYLENLDYPAQYIQFCFVINNCTDATPEILTEFANRHPGQVTLINKNRELITGHKRGNYDLGRLAELRNILLTSFLQSGCEYLFSVDSDILIPAQVLTQLIEDDCDIVSALVCNGYEVNDIGLYNILNYREGCWEHIRGFPRDRVFKVDCTGAVCLIKRNVIEKHGVRYSAAYGAEDIGFCVHANAKGLGIWCDGRIECQHVMNEKNIYI
ncbi:MAG: hypothetical protein ABFC94_06740 [Syntrophomonas sp.]